METEYCKKCGKFKNKGDKCHGYSSLGMECVKRVAYIKCKICDKEFSVQYLEDTGLEGWIIEGNHYNLICPDCSHYLINN